MSKDGRSIVLPDGLGSVQLVESMGDSLSIVNAARKSFNKEHAVFNDADYRLMNYLYENEHMSPFEMVEFMFSITAPLFVVRQWQRHRTWSYNEVSRRYTSDGLDFYVPSAYRQQSTDNKQASGDLVKSIDHRKLEEDVQEAVDVCLDTYYGLLGAGVCREQARMVLPQNMMVNFVAKVDLRNLLHFLNLRLDPHAQVEIQQFAAAMFYLIGSVVPEVIDVTINDAVYQRAIHLCNLPGVVFTEPGDEASGQAGAGGDDSGVLDGSYDGRPGESVQAAGVGATWYVPGARGHYSDDAD